MGDWEMFCLQMQASGTAIRSTRCTPLLVAVLFQSRIHPARQANTLSSIEVEAIRDSVKSVLSVALEVWFVKQG
jgi:hypothetical protein